jgi:hypothetical protein
MTKETKKAAKIGRPTKYKPQFCKEIIKFFNIPLYYETTEQKMSASGVVMDVEVMRPSHLPTFERFAFEIDVCMDTLQEWRATHPEFSVSYRRAKALQKNHLMAHGLSGGYNSNFAKFVAINCTDMMDTTHIKQESEVTVKDYGLAFDLSKKPEDVAKDNEAK